MRGSGLGRGAHAGELFTHRFPIEIRRGRRAVDRGRRAIAPFSTGEGCLDAELRWQLGHLKVEGDRRLRGAHGPVVSREDGERRVDVIARIEGIGVVVTALHPLPFGEKRAYEDADTCRGFADIAASRARCVAASRATAIRAGAARPGHVAVVGAVAAAEVPERHHRRQHERKKRLHPFLLVV